MGGKEKENQDGEETEKEEGKEMRIEWHDTEDISNLGQFVVYAENEIERGLLRRFASRAYNKKWSFRFHGSCHSCDLGNVTSFNFGFVKAK